MSRFDRNRAEGERLSAETRLRHVIDSMSDAFSALDRDWQFTYVNDRRALSLARNCDTAWGSIPPHREAS
jgi:PAS domain-containing protein